MSAEVDMAPSKTIESFQHSPSKDLTWTTERDMEFGAGLQLTNSLRCVTTDFVPEASLPQDHEQALDDGK